MIGSTKPQAMIVSLEGTLVDFDSETNIGYINKSVLEVILRCINPTESGEPPLDLQIILVSTKEEKQRKILEEWLDKSIPFEYELFLRPEGIYPFTKGDLYKCESPEEANMPISLPDFAVKVMIFRKFIQDKYEVFFIIDHDSASSTIYKKLGLLVLKEGKEPIQ